VDWKITSGTDSGIYLRGVKPSDVEQVIERYLKF
jgi:hypothetical protein